MVTARGDTLEAKQGVLRVEYAAEYARQVQRSVRTLNTWVLIVGAVLIGASVLLIFNTIRTAVFARRREIEVMRLGCASNSFIRLPFVVEGLVHGLLGALLAAFAAWGFDALWKRNFVNQVAFELLNQIRWEPNQLWSANRDAPCGKQIEGASVSNTCSSQNQRPGEFAATLNNLTGRPVAVGSGGTSAPPSTEERPSVRAVVDDARTDPYPIWQAESVYVMGEKVVWHRNVFEAKWWTKNDLPDAPVGNEWDWPWRFLGPVLPTDKPPPRPNVPDGTYPKWSELVSYSKGTRVLHQALAYEAKWFTLGDTPRSDRPWESPWAVVTDIDAPSDAAAPSPSTVTTSPAAAVRSPAPGSGGAAQSTS